MTTCYSQTPRKRQDQSIVPSSFSRTDLLRGVKREAEVSTTNESSSLQKCAWAIFTFYHISFRAGHMESFWHPGYSFSCKYVEVTFIFKTLCLRSKFFRTCKSNQSVLFARGDFKSTFIIISLTHLSDIKIPQSSMCRLSRLDPAAFRRNSSPLSK